MMGYGFDPALSEGSLKPPIFLTSTFVFETAADGKRFFEGITGKRPGGGTAEGLVYSRFNGPNQEILEDRLQIWEDAEQLADLLQRHDRDRDAAADLRPARRRRRSLRARSMRRPRRSSTRSSASSACTMSTFPAGATREELDDGDGPGQGQGPVSLIYLESPANPTNALVDVEAVARRARRGVRRRGRAAADRDRQHLPRAACGPSRSTRARTSASTA